MNPVKLGTVLAVAFTALSITPSGANAESAGAAPGEQRRWTLDFRVQLEQLGGKTPVEVRLTGDWISTISGAHRGEYDAVLQFSNAQVSGAGVPGAAASAVGALQRRLERPFWATYRDDGALLAVHFSRGVDPSDQNLLQMIATEAQLVRDESSQARWTSLERDGAGSYLATYNRQEPNIVTKRKVNYIETDGATGVPVGALHVTVDQSELRFLLNPDGEIDALDGTDLVQIGFPGLKRTGGAEAGQLAAKTEIHLTNLHRGEAPELVGSLDRVRQDVVSSPIVSHNPDPAQVRDQSDDNLIEGHTTESLLDAPKANNDDRMRPDRLAALFRRRPQAIADALVVLRKTGPLKHITDGLAAAGSPSAIAALASLAQDKALLTELRIDALTALVLAQHPSQEAMRIPVSMIDESNPEIRSVARFISGAIARAGRTQHPTEAEAIDKVLIERYRQAHDVHDLSDVLAALGNSGGPTTLRVIEDAIGDSRPAVRGAAARALRLAPGPEIDHLLSQAISSDPEGSVRSDAIFAVSFRRPLSSQLAETLVRAARSDPADYVRSNAITLLRRNPKASPNIGETLSWVAANDVKPAIRHLANEALRSTGLGGTAPVE